MAFIVYFDSYRSKIMNSRRILFHGEPQQIQLQLPSILFYRF